MDKLYDCESIFSSFKSDNLIFPRKGKVELVFNNEKQLFLKLFFKIDTVFYDESNNQIIEKIHKVFNNFKNQEFFKFYNYFYKGFRVTNFSR